MEDKEARDILLAMLKGHAYSAEEQEAVRTAIGVLSGTAIAKDNMRKKIAAKKAKHKHNNI